MVPTHIHHRSGRPAAGRGMIAAQFLLLLFLLGSVAPAQQCYQFAGNTGSVDPAASPLVLIIKVGTLPAPTPYVPPAPTGTIGNVYNLFERARE